MPVATGLLVHCTIESVDLHIVGFSEPTPVVQDHSSTGDSSVWMIAVAILLLRIIDAGEPSVHSYCLYFCSR
jgi:hypothetical protein